MQTSQRRGLLVGDVLRSNAAAVPHRPAASLDGDVVDFRRLDEWSNQFAHALHGLGLRRGDRLSWWCDTRLDIAALMFGAAKIGVAVAPLSAPGSAAEVAAQIELVDPQLVVADDHRFDGLAALRPDVPVRRLDGADGLLALAATASTSDAHAPDLHENDVHAIYLTSGTTGMPKGAMVTHRVSWLRSFHGVNPAHPAPGGTFLCTFPQFHMGGWHLPLVTWQDQQEVAWVRRADAEHVLPTIERRAVRRLQTLPAVWERVLDADRSGFDLSSLQLAESGTSATPPAFLDRLRSAFPNAHVRVWYGSTEAGTTLVLDHHDIDRKPNSVGRPAPGVLLELDPATAEMRFRSEFLFGGYLGDPAATAAALDDGWYRSGDLAEVDEEGYVRIRGRLAEVIRTGGEWVVPGEVDAVLASHPAVEQVAVVGLPDPTWGEIVCAVAKVRPGASLSLEELRSTCAGRLAPFKHPRHLVLVDELPTTAATGKVMRQRIVADLLRTAGAS